MKNKLFTLILLTIIIIPQVAFAVWWNPTHWFSRPPNEKPEQVLLQVKTFTTEPQIIEKVTEPIIKEKVITKIINNPDLLKQIELLKKENTNLKSSLDYAVKRISDLDKNSQDKGNQLSSASSYISTYKFTSEDIEKAKEEGREEMRFIFQQEQDKTYNFFRRMLFEDQNLNLKNGNKGNISNDLCRLANTEDRGNPQSPFLYILKSFDKACNDFRNLPSDRS